MAAIVAAAPMVVTAQVTLSKKSPPSVVISPGATAQEKLASQELVNHLSHMLSVPCQVESTQSPKTGSIVVGLASKWMPQAKLGQEDVLLKTQGGRLYLLGGGPRGVIYAVNRFLHRHGVRWWAPWAAEIPKKGRIEIKSLDVIESPRFESRDPFWFHAFDREWARRNGSNSMHSRLTEEDGGKITYSGFVHTFYPLVPPEKHFKDHPDWYSEFGGVRKGEWAQLCTTNPELRKFLVEQVKDRLKQDPTARIISVSQNDWYNACSCPNCKAVDDQQGSHAGTMIELANYVADAIKDEFPLVAVDTLAYQYTRKAPKDIKPRSNVIVRLCSIECDFSKPLTDPANASFAQDIKDWSRLTQRLYVWNYVTNFPNYMMPFPNWDVIGPDQRFFAENGVRGLFEQGAYQSFGSSMAEMHAWVQAQLLWNPFQDEMALRREFLTGYYGAASGPILKYMDLLARAAKPHPMNIWVGPGAPFFDAKTVLEAEKLWSNAEQAVKNDPAKLWRAKIGHLAIRYVILSRWNGLRAEALRLGLKWSLPDSRKAVADEWIALASGPGPKGWSPITHMNESGLTPKAWIERFGVDPPAPELVVRGSTLGLPSDILVPSGVKAFSIQDSEAKLFAEGDLSLTRPDPLASDKAACYLPGSHHEWAFQMGAPAESQSGSWKVYVVVRVDLGSDPNATAFTAGVYSSDLSRGLGGVTVSNGQAGAGYRSYLLTTSELTKGCYVWVAPADAGSKGVWVDRVVFVKEG